MDDLKNRAERAIMMIFEGDSLRKALETVQLSRYQFGKVLNLDPELDRLYARAMQSQADIDADEIKHIADTELDPQKARNMIDVRKWRASKLHSKKYGERLDLAVEGQIDLTAAIGAGLQRAIPASYRKHDEQAQLIDNIAPNANTQTGSEPVCDSNADLQKRREEILS